jgi:GT2 family glycosyltransferase
MNRKRKIKERKQFGKEKSMVKGLTSICLPIHNTDYPPAHYTGNCIGCIKYFTDKKKTPYEIIVIDQASPIELGGLKWQEVVDKYYKFKDNKGYTGGMNRGIEKSTGEYICLMSSDVEVYEHWLEDMIEGLNHVDLVMAYPMYAYPYGRAKKAAELRKEWMDKEPDQYLKSFRDFSCVLAKKELFDKVGLLDEKLFSYSEDVDFAYRMEKMGYTLKANQRVNTHHIGMATGHTMQMQGVKIGDMMNKNKEYIKKKWDLDKYNVPAFKRKK